MPLHLTKIAFGADSFDDIAGWFERRLATGEPLRLTTRYLPKRHLEIVPADGGAGSLYWIHKHALVARSRILSFGEAEGGRVAIDLDPRLVLVHARPKRAHQGWRYLEHKDAPPDLAAGAEGADTLPPRLVGELAAVGLL